MAEKARDPATLKRSLGLPVLTFYGLGTIVGGGFYALVGEVSAEAGMLTPVAFLAASLIGLLSAFSFAELSARFPVSAVVALGLVAAWGVAESVWLAKATSTILLIIYALVNLSLLVVKDRDPDPAGEGPRYAIWLPVLGFTACVTFLLFHALAAVR